MGFAERLHDTRCDKIPNTDSNVLAACRELPRRNLREAPSEQIDTSDDPRRSIENPADLAGLPACDFTDGSKESLEPIAAGSVVSRRAGVDSTLGLLACYPRHSLSVLRRGTDADTCCANDGVHECCYGGRTRVCQEDRSPTGKNYS